MALSFSPPIHRLFTLLSLEGFEGGGTEVPSPESESSSTKFPEEAFLGLLLRFAAEETGFVSLPWPVGMSVQFATGCIAAPVAEVT